MSIEILSIDKVIYDGLIACTPLFTLYNALNPAILPVGANNIAAAVFSDIAPLKTKTPWIIFGHHQNSDTNAMGGFRALENATYIIKCCGLGLGYGGLKPFMDAIDFMMVGDTSGGTSNGLGFTVDAPNGITVYGFQRLNVIRMAEYIDDQPWYQLGAVYQTVTAQTIS